MKRGVLYIAGMLLVLVGASLAFVYSQNEPKFRYVSGYISDTYAIQSYQSPPEEKIYASDCIGCKEEIGNVNVYAEWTSRKQTLHLFQSNSENEVVEKGDKTDETGKKIGDRAISVFKDNEKIQAVRIFWTDGDVFWSVQAPTLELAKAFELSKTFHDSEVKIRAAIKHV